MYNFRGMFCKCEISIVHWYTLLLTCLPCMEGDRITFGNEVNRVLRQWLQLLLHYAALQWCEKQLCCADPKASAVLSTTPYINYVEYAECYKKIIMVSDLERKLKKISQQLYKN